jgi:hypothetical protein
MKRALEAIVVAVSLTASWSGIAVAREAPACAVVEGHPTRCFRTVAEMDRWVTFPGRVAPTLNCSTPLKLHDGTNQLGTLVSIYARGTWVDLSSFSFDNKTSSYTVGACAIDLAAQNGGTGNHYTRCLSAGCVENTMLSGWGNVVSSAYLH